MNLSNRQCLHYARDVEKSDPSGASASPRISVAICTRNGAAFVAEQLRSIYAQTRLPHEIVVSDDDSSDGTVAIAREAIGHDGSDGVSVRFITNPSALGVTKNFEQAIRACTGDLIALSDQDDSWHPNRIEVMADAFSSAPRTELMFSNARLVDADGKPLGESLFDGLEISRADRDQLRAGDAFPVLMKRNLVTGATVMIRRSLAERAMPFPAAWVHDEWLGIVASTTVGVGLIDDMLIDYRQHASNEIGAGSLSLAEKFGRLAEEGSDRNARLLARARVLSQRFEAIAPPIAEKYRTAARAKLAHEEARTALPVSRIRRIGPLLREWRTGRYTRYGRGGADILRDLVQPR